MEKKACFMKSWYTYRQVTKSLENSWKDKKTKKIKYKKKIKKAWMKHTVTHESYKIKQETIILNANIMTEKKPFILAQSWERSWDEAF